MRVLYFSPRICWPIISGAHLRDFYFARQLARNAQLTYIGLVNDDTARHKPACCAGNWEMMLRF